MRLKSKEALDKYFGKRYNKGCEECIKKEKRRIDGLSYMNCWFIIFFCVIGLISLERGQLSSFAICMVGVVYTQFEAIKERDRKIKNFKEELK